METWYELDEEGRITGVSPNFDDFSRENGGPPDLSRSIIGRPLRDFVCGDSTRLILQMLLERSKQQPISLLMRCDSPHLLRLLEMHVTPQRRVTFSTLKTEPRRASSLLQTQKLIKLCSWCNTFQTQQGWVPLEEAAHLLQLLHGPVPDISHGICPRCDEAFESEDFSHLHQGLTDADDSD